MIFAYIKFFHIRIIKRNCIMYIYGGEVYEDEEIYSIEEDDSYYLEKDDDYELTEDDIISIIFLDRMNIDRITLAN